MIAEYRQRKKGIEAEYKELDTVWFMAGSLFNRYPYDIPTEAFSKQLYMEAFAAVQSCIVHLQVYSHRRLVAPRALCPSPPSLQLTVSDT